MDSVSEENVEKILKEQEDLSNFLEELKFRTIESIWLDELDKFEKEYDKKYSNLYEILDSEMPTDIQVMINNNEIASAILRIIEVIGQDNLETMDDDTLFFIISTLNQLNIDKIRNDILLKVLPLKV